MKQIHDLEIMYVGRLSSNVGKTQPPC